MSYIYPSYNFSNVTEDDITDLNEAIGESIMSIVQYFLDTKCN